LQKFKNAANSEEKFILLDKRDKDKMQIKVIFAHQLFTM